MLVSIPSLWVPNATDRSICAAMNIAITSLGRELPRKWGITGAALTVDFDLLADDKTARDILSLADLPDTDLPSELPLHARALATAQHAAQAELMEVSSTDAMARAKKTDRDYIDGRARIRLYESIIALVLSPSPSLISKVALTGSLLLWGLRLVLCELFLGFVSSWSSAHGASKCC